MQTLYIDQKGCRLSADRDRLLVHSALTARPLSVGLACINSVVISAKTELCSQVLLACAKNKVAVLIIDSRRCENHVQFVPTATKVVARKIKQFEFCQHSEMRLACTQKLVIHQFSKQLRLLNRWQQADRLSLLRYESSGQVFTQLHASVLTAKNLEELRGLEGAGTRQLYQGLIEVSPPWCRFSGRNRRPPKDPLNVLLSLSFVLMHDLCVRALQAQSFDPMFGFYHEPLHGRYSLACDLLECLRPQVVRFVLELVWSEQLKPADFAHGEARPCLLKKTGRAKFYAQWHLHQRIWSRYARALVAHWAKQLDRPATSGLLSADD